MTSETHDARTTSDCTITWFEDATSGRGFFHARFEDGGKCEVPEENAGGGPITAASDSDAIAQSVAAELSLEVLSVDHDGEYIHATMRQL